MRCAATPTGAVVNRHGCPLDSDQDGVFDGLDLCPSTSAEERGSVDQSGCAPSETEKIATTAVPTPLSDSAAPSVDVVPAGSSDTLLSGDTNSEADAAERSETSMTTASSDAGIDPTTMDSDGAFLA